MGVKHRVNPLIRRQSADSPPEDAKTTRFNFLFEHLCLIVMTGLVCLAFVVWLLAVSTDFWVVVVAGGNKGILLNDANAVHSLPMPMTSPEIGGGFTSERLVFLWSYSGLWRRCDVFTDALDLVKEASDDDDDVNSGGTVVINHTISTNVSDHVTSCRHHTFFPLKDSVGGLDQGQGHGSEVKATSATKRPSSDFVQAELTIVLIVLVLMAMAVAFSVYALVHPRYMYKRVAAALHLLTAVILVVLLGLVKSSEHLATHHGSIHPSILERSHYYYGYSYLLAVNVLMVFISAALAFMCLSKKRRNLLYDADMVLK